MTPPAETVLFAAQPARPLQAWSTIACSLAVLIANAELASIPFSSGGLAVGLLLLAFSPQRRRLYRTAALIVLALVLVAMLFSAILGLPRLDTLRIALRIACGVVWLLWAGSRMTWPDLRAGLRPMVPEPALETLDQSVRHGSLTRVEWERRLAAARLRIGHPRVPLRAWGGLLAEGAWSTLLRLEALEASARLRGAAPGQGVGSPLRLKGVYLEREGHRLLGPLSLTLASGSWVLLCGPSGAGKSTLLRLLSGLDAPSAGHIERLGRTLAPTTSLRDRLDGRVALLTQNPEHHFLESTVSEDIAWGLRRRGFTERRVRDAVARIAERLALTPLLHRPCHHLSFGEQRRAALAGLLVLEPDVLLLDEPTSGLDPVASATLVEGLRDVIRGRGVTCLWATHDLHALPGDADRLLLLRDGELVEDGPVASASRLPALRRAGLVPPAPAPVEASCPMDLETSP